MKIKTKQNKTAPRLQEAAQLDHKRTYTPNIKSDFVG